MDCYKQSLVVSLNSACLFEHGTNLRIEARRNITYSLLLFHYGGLRPLDSPINFEAIMDRKYAAN